MIAVADLEWAPLIAGASHAPVPGTPWTIIRRRGGSYAAYLQVGEGTSLPDRVHEIGDDAVDLQCWLATLTDGGNDVAS